MRTLDVNDATKLADRQLTLDRERTARFPQLLTRKLQRMSASPLAFLRGAAPLFYEILAVRPDLADGPTDEGWIVGDLHLENFGAYRPEAASKERKKGRPAVFELNDFDDTIIGPWRFDVIRLSTSILLAGREMGATGIVALELVDKLLEGWARAAFDDEPPPETPLPVQTLVEQVRTRPRLALLDARTEIVKGKRRFIRGPRYSDLPSEFLEKVPKAFRKYVDSLDEKPSKGSFEIVDSALRIAGTGSLGSLRIAVLAEGKGALDGAWIFDMKEQGAPSASTLLGEPEMDPAERVATGFRACVERPPRMIGTSSIRGLPLFVRRLAPQEDKLNLRRIKSAELRALAAYLGALLGRAHARASKKGRARWSQSDLRDVRAKAITLAGMHEAIYLALCDRMRELLPPSVVLA